MVKVKVLPAITLTSVAPASVSEDDDLQTITASAQLDAAKDDENVSVTLDAMDGTARIADGDCEDPASNTLTIPQGDTSTDANFVVEINSDDLYEGAETFMLALISPQGAKQIQSFATCYD